MRRDVESAAIAEWFHGYLGSSHNPTNQENETYRRLGVGPLLGDVIDRFTFATSNVSPQKMALYGTHDTTIAAILSTLDVYDGRWPCFTSNITFELFKGQRGGFLSFLKRDQYFVRMTYNHKVLSLPACKATGKHREGDETLCTLEAFKEVIEKVRPVDWSQECRVPGITCHFCGLIISGGEIAFVSTWRSSVAE
jgi:acid phosphatase